MNRILALIVLCILCTLTQVAYATPGGEGDNTNCNGVGNPNSYCDGTEGDPEPPVCEDPPRPPTLHNHVCIVPVRAVNAYLTTSNFFFNPDVKTCERQCRTIAKTCSSVGTTQTKCFTGIIKGARKLSLANCKAATDPIVRKQCQINVQRNSGVNLEIFRANGRTAQTICRDSVEDCVAACQE